MRRGAWFLKACEIHTLLLGERPEDREWILGRLVQDVRDELAHGDRNVSEMREGLRRSFAASDHSEGHSVRVPDPPMLRLVDNQEA